MDQMNVLAVFPEAVELGKVLHVGQALMETHPGQRLLIDHRIHSDGEPVELIIYRAGE